MAEFLFLYLEYNNMVFVNKMATGTDVTFQFTLFIFFRYKDSKSSQEKGKLFSDQW